MFAPNPQGLVALPLLPGLHSLALQAPFGSQGNRQEGWPRTSWSACAGPHDPTAYGTGAGGSLSNGWRMRHVSSTESSLVNRE
jgi:hypothetical protein